MISGADPLRPEKVQPHIAHGRDDINKQGLVPVQVLCVSFQVSYVICPVQIMLCRSYGACGSCTVASGTSAIPWSYPSARLR